MKKIRGKIHYFGRWGKIIDGVMTRVEGDGWAEALAEYEKVAEDLHAGRTPREQAEGFTVGDLGNEFLTAKTRSMEAGELSARMFQEYKATCVRMVAAFGKGRLVSDLQPADFAKYRAGLTKQFGPVRVGNEVQKVRTVFKYAYDNGLIDRPVRFGSEFRKPSRKVMRVHRAKSGKKLFTAAEVRALVDAAGIPLKAMVLLGINCAFGNSDVGTLPLSVLDLEGGWVSFPRPKTGLERRARLWPETVAALREALAERPTPKDKAIEKLMFITKFGNAWAEGGTAFAVSQEFGKLMKAVKVQRPGLGFYSLRHSFRTVADATRDPNAIRTVMGHVDSTIDAVYTHHIADSRLEAVAEHVRAWLFAEPKGGE